MHVTKTEDRNIEIGTPFLSDAINIVCVYSFLLFPSLILLEPTNNLIFLHIPPFYNIVANQIKIMYKKAPVQSIP